MIRNALFVCIAALGLSAAGCKGDDAKMEQFIGIMEDISKAAKSANGDCGKMADAVGPVVDKNAGAMKDLKTWADGQKNDKAKAEAMMKKYGDRMMKAMDGMGDLAKCATDPKMEAINKKMKDMM
ncbi:MAG TPA: hypothetical protein VGM90_05590 [Kofleriaceae bacterium]|jgi:hypothetical protein